jgi:light-regulated signal transduction histidine kinase (bacteriophytochrome)
MAIVRRVARELTGADGATFVLRDGDKCYYADEDAIAPLWKGQRFPMSHCISGWVMLNREPAIIPDIYDDPRIPSAAYRPTFVKSLIMVPIRKESPFGAIGNYWAHNHQATTEEIELLQALANTTSVAMENVQVYSELEQRVRDRTAQLEAANRELESFSYSVSHDLRAPLRHIDAFAGLLAESSEKSLDGESRQLLSKLRDEAGRMGHLIEDLLNLAGIARVEMRGNKTHMSKIAAEIVARLAAEQPGRDVEVIIADGLITEADSGLMRVVLENLLSNAWKYSGRKERSRIEFGITTRDGEQIFFVKDNGAGFDMAYAQNLFGAFQRLHTQDEFPGTGVGLATVQRIIHRHGGRIWAESAVGQGATFCFTLGPGQ